MPLTDKPNRSAIDTFKQPEADADLDAELKDKLMRLTAAPTVKASYPITSNQEFGWDSDLAISTKKWSYGKPVCPETKYASNYFTMTGRSPFANPKHDKK